MKRTVVGADASLKINQVGIPKDSLKHNLAEKLIREKKVNYIQKGERKISLKFHKPVIDIGDILYVNVMKGDCVVMNGQPTLHRLSVMGF